MINQRLNVFINSTDHLLFKNFCFEQRKKFDYDGILKDYALFTDELQVILQYCLEIGNNYDDQQTITDKVFLLGYEWNIYKNKNKL